MMDSALTFYGLCTLFSTMTLLAALPGVTVVLVVTRSATLGFWHGVVTTLGLVAGDGVLILLAVFGLGALGSLWEPAMAVVACVSGTYLLWLGRALWRFPPHMALPRKVTGTTFRASFLAGFLMTLGDQKAVLFYLGLLPAVTDVTKLKALDVAFLIGCAIVALFSAKLIYAWLGSRAASWVDGRLSDVLGRFTAVLLMGTGGVLLLQVLHAMLL